VTMPDASKPWISRPEGKVGTFVFIAALIAGGASLLYFWGLILPWLIGVMANTLQLVGLCAALAAIGFVIFDPRWRNLVFYLYKSAMRAITGAFIEIDPIGILKTYVSSLRKRLDEMDQSISNLSGQMRKLKEQINSNEQKRVHSLQVMQEAQKRVKEDATATGMKNVFTLQARQAGRLEKSNLTLQGLYDKMESMYKVLKKYREASALLVEDINGEVEVKSAERAALLAGYNAFSKAKKIMAGGGDEKELFDLTMEKLADDYGMKMGEIDDFMNVSKDFINGVDLDKGIFETQGLEALEAWEKKSDSLLLNNNTSTGVRVSTSTGPVEDQAPNSISELFRNQTKN